ncbi:MAG: phosphatidylinositol-specific phospholipase C domain-containing protein [Candidatus Thiodiazotropha sp.]
MTSGIGSDAAAAVRTFGTIFRDVVHKYSQCQAYSLTEQLNHGIRYFDSRVSTKPNTNSIHFIHAFYGPTVESGLKEINSFLSSHSKEIVFLDFNHFYDMNDEHHKQLLELLQNTFKDKLCMYVGPENATLKMMWENNLQVIVFYQNKVSLICVSKTCSNIITFIFLFVLIFIRH